MFRKENENWEQSHDLTEIMENTPQKQVPDNFTAGVMARLSEEKQTVKTFSFGRLFSTNLDFGFQNSVTKTECAFLLLIVGYFYLVTGFVTTWGFHDAIAGGNINPWLKMQPYITIGSALFILSAAFFITYRPQATAFIQYAIIVHTFFILVNAIILESILSFPIALIYVLILTMLATGFSVLLIDSIRSIRVDI